MTTIQPTATPTVLQVAAAAAVPTVVMPKPPPDLARLQAGTALEVLVLAQEATDSAEARPGNVTVRTPSGDVSVQISVPVDRGARLALEIVRAAPQQLTARIVTVDGQPPPAPVPATPRAQAAVISDPPPELARAPAGTRIEGRVIAREPGPEPNVVVRTPAGDVTVRVPVPVETGARIALEIERAAPREVTARVISIDGKPPPPPPTPAATTVVIPRPPPALAQLESGAPLEVRVLARETPVASSDANAVVRTPAGDVPVRLPVPVDAGAKIALEIIRAGANQVTARIVSIDGKPLVPVAEPVPALPPMRPLPQPVVLPIGNAWFAGTPMPLPQLQPLAGFIINAPLTTPGSPPPVLAAPVGTELAVRVTAFVPPAPGATPGPIPIISAPVVTLPGVPPQPQPGIPIPAQPAAIGMPALTPTTVPGAIPQPPMTLQPGPTPGPVVTTPVPGPALPGLELPKPQDFTAPTPRPPQTVQPSPPLATVTGTVIAVTPQEAPVVRTPIGDIQIPVRANTPVGSTLTLEILAMLPPTMSPDRAAPLPPWSTVPPAALALASAPGWASLSDAMQLLQRVDPQTAAQLTATVPDGGPRTAVAVMAFVQAMRSGDPRAWPGDATLRGLERSGPRGAQLAAQISGEVKEMAARAADAGTEWRSLPVPWNADGKIERLSLITRREGADESEDEKKKKAGKGGGTRFLIDLDLSRLGALQLDGMFRKGAKSFDMMVRTKEPLPPEMLREMPGLFAAANAAMGMTGTLSFQVVKKFPDPTKERASADRSGIWA